MKLIINYGITLANLGIAYSELSRISSEFGVTQAISYFREALDFLNPDIAPRRYGAILNNLGELYRNLPGGLEDNLRQAIKFYTEALRVYKSETAPFKYALTMHNLGIAYGELPTNRQENLKKAIECLEQSLRLGIFLGDLYCKQGKWHSAYDAYDLAHRAAELMYSSAFIPVSQQEEIKINTDLCDRLVNICLKLRDNPDFVRKALVYAEAGKARTFLDQMGQGNFPSPSEVPENLLKEEQALLDELHQKEQFLVTSNVSIEIEKYAKERQDIKTQLEKFWDSLSREYPTAKEYVNLRQAKSPTWEELTELASSLGEEVALVEFYILEDKIAAFILRAGWEKPHIFVLPISRQALRYYSQNYQEFWEYYNVSQQEREKKLPPTSGWLQFGKVTQPNQSTS